MGRNEVWVPTTPHFLFARVDHIASSLRLSRTAEVPPLWVTYVRIFWPLPRLSEHTAVPPRGARQGERCPTRAVLIDVPPGQ